MKTKQLSLVALVILIALDITTPLWADLSIVPGKSVGDISLGMERAEVLRRLGTPQREDVLVNGTDENSADNFKPSRKLPVQITPDGTAIGIFRDDWIISTPLKNAIEFLGNFVTVYYLDRRVVQIEVSSAEFKTEGKLSTKDSALKFRKAFPNFVTIFGKSRIPGSIIETKHYAVIEDAVDVGIAWRYGVTGNMGEDPDENSEIEVVTVHTAGKEMAYDPDLNSRFLWKDKPTGLSTDL